MKPITTGFAITALAAACMNDYTHNNMFTRPFYPPEKPLKPCLVCGKPHQHNNSFCSAECCKSYRKEGK